MSEMSNQIPLILAPAVPLLTCVLLAVPALRERAMQMSPLAALPALLLALAGAPGVVLDNPWSVKLAGLALDDVGRIFLGFSAALWFLSDWFARGYLTDDRHALRFHVFFLLSMAGNFMLILARDIPTFYSGFALMGFASCGLVVHRGDEAAIRAGRIYLILAAVGEVMLFVALGMLAAAAGTVEISGVVNGEMPVVAVVLLLAGFGIKAGALALHFWLPLAHPAAPVPASAVLSGAMIKAGLFGWLRFLPLGLAAFPAIGTGLVVAGLTAALLGTVAGVSQRNPKTVLAYSSFSQMGIITVGIGVGFLRPDAWPGLLMAIAIYALHHGLSKGALFLGVTPASEAATRREIRLARVGLVIPALALAGAPFTSGTVAKVALKAKLDYLPDPWGATVGFLLTLAAVGTTLLMARFLLLSWPSSSGSESGVHHRVWIPWMTSVACVVAGIWILPGAAEKIPALAAPAKVWGALWPVLAGALVALAGNYAVRRLGLRAPKGIPAGDIVVPFEKLAGRWRGGMPGAKGRMKGREGNAEGREPGPALLSLWAEALAHVERRLRVFASGAVLLAVVILVFFLMLSR